MGKNMMSVEVGGMEKGIVSPLRPVSEMLTEYGLSMVNAASKRGEKTVPSYPHEEDLIHALSGIASSIDELRILGAMWIEATFPSCGHDGPSVNTVADLLYVVFDPVQSFAKTAIIKDMMKRGVIVNSESNRPYSMRDNARQFINRNIALSEGIMEHIAELDARVDTAMDETQTGTLLTFSNKKEETFEDMKMHYLKRNESAITLADHFLEHDLVSRIHVAAHSGNKDVRLKMQEMGIYTGPIKREESAAVADRNVIILYGPPGPGKTSAAYALAGELGLPLLTLAVDDVIASVWGESEENMRAAFEEYEYAAKLLGKRPVLLMDECDSLLVKRTRESGNGNIGNAMANVVNVALQEIEKFRGTLIMTTNDIESLDPAFARRVDESIKLDYPSMDLQRKMWQKYLNINAPGVDAIDIEALLAAGNLTGAHIVKVIERTVKQQLIKQGDDFVFFTSHLLDEIHHELKSF
ncbi:MAG: ATP-binding protein, partial [Ignavibacteria bacterium]